VKTFQDTLFPKLKQEIDAAAGFSVEIEVDWESLAAPEYGHLYADAFPKVYFQPLINAFKGVAVDDMGKEALKAGLKRVKIKDESSSWPTFEGGVLTLKFPAVANLDYVDDRRKAIQDILEKNL
jgi:hypothetical protein